MAPRLSIFTPTSDRADSLRRLYESLSTQSRRQDFEWLVVDDGSTDFTRQLVESFMREKRIAIRYIYKVCGGYLPAWLTALDAIDSELCLCIDPDRFMPDDAVELILNKWTSEGSDSYAGVAGLIFDLDTDRPTGGYLPDDMASCWPGYLEAYSIHRGELCMALRTDLLKNAPRPEVYPDEQDARPAALLTRILDSHPLLVVNRNICFREPQRSFMTEAEQTARLYTASPRSFAALFRERMILRHSTPAAHLRAAIGYIACSLLARDTTWAVRSPRPQLTSLLYPAGLLLAAHLRRQANLRR